MSKDEFLKIQTCVLKVNIHCDGCKHKVKKILQKIEGVYTTKIDSEQGKVTVSGNVDPNTLIKKLIKSGKHAELWGAKPNNNNNQNNLNNQFKNLQMDHGGKGGGGGGNNKGQGQKGGGNNQQKGGGGGGGGGPQGQNPQLQQHLQQLQQMKGLQDMKMLPQFMKDMKMPPNHGKEQNAKSVKFKLPEDEDLSDDDFDDDYDDDDDEFDDDELDDEMDHAPLNKMKPMIGNGHGGPQMPNVMMQNMMNGQLPQHMKPAGNGGNNGGNGAGNGKKGGGGGGGGNIPVQIHPGAGGGGGKKGGNGNNGGGNQNQGGGAKGGKNGGGGQNSGGNGGQNKNGGGGGGGGPANGNHFMANGAKKVNDGAHGMPNMMAMNGGGNVGHMQNMPPMGQMGHHMSNHLPMGQMSNLAAVQGLPASAMSGGAGGGPGYFPGGGGPEHMQGNPNPYYQQQLAAMMMNQQRANGNERFQPMMYARPPPAVNYMPPYPPYPYPPPPGERADQYAMFSDENTSSCSVM